MTLSVGERSEPYHVHHLIGSYKSFTHSVEYLYDTQLALTSFA
jgi:hypothetical protein